jgi:diguanylate cyclase (GGDEF)-like protein
VAEVLGSNLRAEDLAARYGGEEFVLVLPETDSGRAMEAANRIIAGVMRKTSRITPDGKPCTVSIGVASCENGDVSCEPSLLIKCADDALYAAKRGGKNKVEINRFSVEHPKEGG